MPCNQDYERVDGEVKGYYQWGSSGKKYHYEPGDEEERKAAKEKCEEQGQAIKASQNE